LGIYYKCELGKTNQNEMNYCKPPEMFFEGKYIADVSEVWSLGMILFYMLFGNLPWRGKSEVGFFNALKDIPLKIPSQKQQLNPKTILLLTQMLNFDKTKRITWNEVKNNEILKSLQKDYLEKHPPLVDSPDKKWKFNIFSFYCQNDFILKNSFTLEENAIETKKNINYPSLDENVKSISECANAQSRISGNSRILENKQIKTKNDEKRILEIDALIQKIIDTDKMNFSLKQNSQYDNKHQTTFLPGSGESLFKPKLVENNYKGIPIESNFQMNPNVQGKSNFKGSPVESNFKWNPPAESKFKGSFVESKGNIVESNFKGNPLIESNFKGIPVESNFKGKESNYKGIPTESNFKGIPTESNFKGSVFLGKSVFKSKITETDMDQIFVKNLNAINNQIEKYDLFGKTIGDSELVFRKIVNLELWGIQRFLLMKKLIKFRLALNESLSQEENLLNLPNWHEFTKNEKFLNLMKKLQTENNSLLKDFEKLYRKTVKGLKKFQMNETNKIEKFLNLDLTQNFDSLFFICLFLHIKTIGPKVEVSLKYNDFDKAVKMLMHKAEIIDCIIINELEFMSDISEYFDINEFNRVINSLNIETLENYVEKKEKVLEIWKPKYIS